MFKKENRHSKNKKLIENINKNYKCLSNRAAKQLIVIKSHSK